VLGRSGERRKLKVAVTQPTSRPLDSGDDCPRLWRRAIGRGPDMELV